MDNVIPLKRGKRTDATEKARRQLGEKVKETHDVTHVVPRMHVIKTGALHPEPAYFPTPDPAWTISTTTSWMLGTLYAETGLECRVTWNETGAGSWTLQMWPDHQPITGLTVASIWDMIGGAVMGAKATQAAKK